MKVLVLDSCYSQLNGTPQDVLDVSLNEDQEIILCLDVRQPGSEDEFCWVKKSETESLVSPSSNINEEKKSEESFIAFTKEQRDNLIINALEGGSNYWCLPYEGDVLSKTEEEKENGISFAERVIKTVESGKSITIWDAEEETEHLGLISLENLKTAEKLMFEHFNSHYDDVINENDDATTADVFLQLVVVGNVIFG